MMIPIKVSNFDKLINLLTKKFLMLNLNPAKNESTIEITFKSYCHKSLNNWFYLNMLSTASTNIIKFGYFHYNQIKKKTQKIKIKY